MKIAKYLHWEFIKFENYILSLSNIKRLVNSSPKSIVYQKEKHKYPLIAINFSE